MIDFNVYQKKEKFWQEKNDQVVFMFSFLIFYRTPHCFLFSIQKKNDHQMADWDCERSKNDGVIFRAGVASLQVKNTPRPLMTPTRKYFRFSPIHKMGQASKA